MTADLNIVEADFARADHRDAVLSLLNASAMDPAGNGQPLTPEVRAHLLARLRAQPSFLTHLTYVGEVPVAIAISFQGQSHAAGAPLLYLSDFFVQPAHRRCGTGRSLLKALEQKARQLGCCRLVLEVREENLPARALYAAEGFVLSMSPLTAVGSICLVKQLH